MNNNDNKNNLGDVGEEIFARRKASPGPHDSRQIPPRTPINRAAMPTTQNGAVSRGPVKRAPSAAKSVGSKTKQNTTHAKDKKCKLSYKISSHFEPARRIVLAAFSVIALFSVILCSVLAYSYSGDSIRLTSLMNESERSSSKEYVIVYGETDEWGETAAEELRQLFFQKTGASLKVAPDSESVARHEIRVGYTNRSADDYVTTLAALGNDGYAVLLRSGENVDIAALSENGARTAVKYFVDSYVGSYMNGKLTFSRNMSISFVSRNGEEPNISLLQSKIRLSFTETGKFRVLVFSDADINPNTIAAIGAMAETEKPHLVLFAGDVSSGMTAKAELEAYLKTLTAPLEERKIPWAAVFGEQDTDGGLSAEAQMEVYTSFEYCVAKSDFVSGGTVSYFLPVYPSGENAKAPAFGIWAMGETGMLSGSGSGVSGDPILSEHIENGTDYGYVTAEQIAFFTENRKILDRTGGGSLPSVMVCHTPVPEFAVIAENPDQTRMLGNFGEPVASSPVNSGLFAALLEARNVLGLYCGHDHLNSFAGRYCGIELGYSASIGYDGYGFGGTFDINNSLRGGRMIELTLKDGQINCSSRMVYASDYGIGLN